jgi:hypothetical protein
MDNVRRHMHNVLYVGVFIRSRFGGVCKHTESLLTANKEIDSLYAKTIMLLQHYPCPKMFGWFVYVQILPQAIVHNLPNIVRLSITHTCKHPCRVQKACKFTLCSQGHSYSDFRDNIHSHISLYVSSGRVRLVVGLNHALSENLISRPDCHSQVKAGRTHTYTSSQQ